MEMLLSSVDRNAPRCVSFVAFLFASLAVPVNGWTFEQPKSFLDNAAQATVDQKTLTPIESSRLLAEDAGRGKDHPFRFAVPEDVHFALENSGTWQTLADGSRIWRIRIKAPGARSLNLGITRFDLPAGAQLWIYDPNHSEIRGPYTMKNRSAAGNLFTPVIRGDEVIVEVDVPSGTAQPTIEIGRVNKGYRGFEMN